MAEFFGNPPAIVITLIKGFIVILALLWFITPLIIIGINDKMKKIARGFREMSDSMADLGDQINKQRKDSNISKLMEDKEI